MNRLVRLSAPLVCAAACFLSGCASLGAGPVADSATATVEAGLDATWLAAVDVLTEDRYTFHQLDREAGVVITDWRTNPKPMGDLDLPEDTKRQWKVSVIVTDRGDGTCAVRTSIVYRHWHRTRGDSYYPVYAMTYDSFYERLGRRLGVDLTRQPIP